MKTVDAVEMNKHPDDQLMNVFADCPFCHREEWFVVLRKNNSQVVRCEQSPGRFEEYIIEYLEVA